MKAIKTNTEKYLVLCRRCGNDKGMVRKYNLDICRRCFKDIALGLGFQKFD